MAVDEVVVCTTTTDLVVVFGRAPKFALLIVFPDGIVMVSHSHCGFPVNQPVRQRVGPLNLSAFGGNGR